MTRMERKAMDSKRFNKMLKKVSFATALISGGALASLLTGDATALVLITFFVAPLFFTTRRIYTR